MTKGTKIFRIMISVLLALTMLISAFFVLLVCVGISKESYDIYVAGVKITRSNEDDVLGDGTVYYNDNTNILVFDNATIASEETVVYSKIDLQIQLIGENKLICTGETSATGIYAGDYNLNKDLAILGDGSLTVEIPNASGEAAGICAANLTIASAITVVTPDCENMAHGIVCASSLMIVDNGDVVVKNGASNYSSAVRVRGSAFFEEGTSLEISANPGCTGVCKGFTVSGDLFMGKNTTLDVSIADDATDLGECIRISGLMEVGVGSTVNASAKNAYAIECFGAIEANKDAVISAVSDQNAADIFCSGRVINCGAQIHGEMDASE